MKLTLNDVVNITNALKETPFKKEGVINAAINIARLAEPISIVDSIRTQLLAKHNAGSSKFESAQSPELSNFVEEFNLALTEQVEVQDFKKIKIELVDDSRVSNQELLSELIKHSIIVIQ